MKVYEILMLAATHIGRSDLKNFISSPTEDEALLSEREDLLSYYNSTEKELATDYFPLMAEENIATETGEIFYDDFSRPVAAVKGVYSADGVRQNVEFFAEYMRTAKGTFRVVYSYIPSDKALDDECERFYFVPTSVFVAGIAKRYCLSSGLAEEGTMWNQTFNDCVCSARARRKLSRRITARRWI